MTRFFVLLLLFSLWGCDETMRVQHRAHINGITGAWPSGVTNRPLPKGVVALGAQAYEASQTQPPRLSAALLARGRQRYDIFCSECHGFTGNGDGMVVRRGYPRPPSLLSQGVRAQSADQLLAVISQGKGVMASYAVQIAPRDRWAIVAYVRALQLSQPHSSATSAE